MTAQTAGHWCKQGTGWVLTANPEVPQRLQRPIWIPLNKKPLSVTVSQGRHRTRIVWLLWFHTGGAFKKVWSDQLYQKPLKNPAVSNQFAYLNSHFLKGPQPTWYLIVLGLNYMSTLMGHFVLSPRERDKRDTRDSRGDEAVSQMTLFILQWLITEFLLSSQAVDIIWL